MKSLATLFPMILLAASVEVKAQNTVPDTPAARLARETAPQLFKYTQDVLFGDLWKRKELLPRDRSLVTLASLMANGQTAQMTSHVNLALKNGVKAKEIAGLIHQLSNYTSAVNAKAAAVVTRQVFSRQDLHPAPLPETTQAKPAERSRQDMIIDKTVLAELPWYPEISARDRSLVTVAALIAQGQLDQLPSHLNKAMDLGLSREQAAEVTTHLAFYAGWPRAMSSLPVLQAVFAERN